MPDEINVPWEDKLQLQGILSRGYGIIPKFVMRDTELSAEAKAIYALFCALSGKGSTSFPGADTIMDLLGITNKTYYKHRQMLIDNGYIEITQRRVGREFSSNIYTLVSNPKKYEDSVINCSNASINAAHLKYKGIRGSGFGIIPYSLMADQRLAAKAKALFAYLSSYAGNENAAYPSVELILHELNLSKNTYVKVLNQLKETGYLTVERQRVGGRYKGNDYILSDFVESSESQPSTKISTTMGSKNKGSPGTRNSTTKKSITKISDTKNSTAINNSPVPITILNKNTLNQSQSGNEPENDLTDREKAETQIKNLISYEDLIQDSKISTNAADTLISIAAEPLYNEKTSYKINGRQVQGREVREAIKNLDSESFRRVLNSIAAYEGKISNIKAYSITSLYNAVIETQTRDTLKQKTESQTGSNSSFDDLVKLYESLNGKGSGSGAEN